MPVEVVELGVGVTRVVLTGRIDIAGAQAIDMPMSLVGGSHRTVEAEALAAVTAV
jgi:anti-sigma B factor antagonist